MGVFPAREHARKSHHAAAWNELFSHVATLISAYGMHESSREYSAEALCFEDG
jgi:hypothetical protein